MRFIRNNINAIAEDSRLRYFGAALAALNILTAAFWLIAEPVNRILATSEPPVCWPFLSECFFLRRLDSGEITVVLICFLALALGNVALFLSRHVTSGYVGLCVVTALKCAVILQDYRLIHNQHYMATWVTLVYLFVPYKAASLKLLVVSFYFWAGILKLNMAWISGAGLYGRRPFGMPEALVPASCVYVLALELCIVFGLIARRPWIFWSSLFQIVMFHISSFWVVGWFYPILMFLILSIFILDRMPPEGAGTSVAGRRVIPPAPALAVACLFALCQGVPALYPGDSTLTGEGRMFALHMFDAPVSCRATRTFRFLDGTVRTEVVRPRFVYPRIACDPLVHFELARDYCREHRDGDTPDFDLILESRKGPGQFQSVVRIDSFCASGTRYRWWRHNTWIRTAEPAGAR